MSIPSIVVREYNPSNGAFIGNVSALTFGNVPVGTHSPVKVIDLAFVGVALVSNLRLALLGAGGIKVTDSPGSAGSDGSTSGGYFGVESSPSFIAKQTCTRHFRNSYEEEANPTNAVAIGLRDANTVSNYIYLDVQLGDSNIGDLGGGYRVLFDYV